MAASEPRPLDPVERSEGSEERVPGPGGAGLRRGAPAGWAAREARAGQARSAPCWTWRHEHRLHPVLDQALDPSELYPLQYPWFCPRPALSFCVTLEPHTKTQSHPSEGWGNSLVLPIWKLIFQRQTLKILNPLVLVRIHPKKGKKEFCPSILPDLASAFQLVRHATLQPDLATNYIPVQQARPPQPTP